MSDTLTMAETAELLGVSYDHFRKEWRAWAATRDFPRPALSRRWSAAAVRAWLADASRPRRGRPPAPAKADPWDQLARLRRHA